MGKSFNKNDEFSPSSGFELRATAYPIPGCHEHPKRNRHSKPHYAFLALEKLQVAYPASEVFQPMISAKYE